MADLTSTLNTILPNVKIYGSYFVSTVAWLILIAVFVTICGVFAFLYIKKKQYQNIIIIFEKINDEWVDTKKDQAMEIKFGDLGMTLFYLRKHKKYIARPTLQSGIRKFYYKIDADGNWRNFKLKDDETIDKLKFHTVEKSITERNVGIRKGLMNRLDDQSWLAKNWAVLVGIITLFLVAIMLWLIMDKWIALANTTNAGMEASKKVLERTDSILSKLDNLLARSGVGSGVVPAGG